MKFVRSEKWEIGSFQSESALELTSVPWFVSHKPLQVYIISNVSNVLSIKKTINQKKAIK